MQESVTQREKNFLETWSAIHEAAFTMTVRNSHPGATAEEIAAMAGVSRRTFFNYFPSKEDAILGVRVPTLNEEIVSAFVSSQEDELTRVVHLFLAVMRTSLPADGFRRRRKAVEELPSLRTRLSHLLAEVETVVRDVLLHRREDVPLEDEHFAYDDGDDLNVLLMMAAAVLRHAVVLHHEEGQDIEELLTRTIAVVRKVVDQTR